MAEDRDYANNSNGCDFDVYGRLVTTSDDGFIRLYDRNFKLIAKKRSQGGNRPFAVSFSPDGTKVAVGFDDSTKVDVLDSGPSTPDPRLLTYLYSPDTADTSDLTDRNLGFAISWSQDGRYLYAGGTYPKNMNGVWKFIIRKWWDEGKGKHIDLPAAANSIMHILPLNNRGIVFSAYDPGFGIYNSGDQNIFYKTSYIADYRDNYDGFLVSNDGSGIQFGYELWGNSPARFSIPDRLLDATLLSQYSTILSPPVTSVTGMSITDWKFNFSPKINGKVLKLDQHETSRSFAISPDRQSFILGADWHIYLFDRNGREIWSVSTPGATWGVNISGNGKVAVAAFSDGTIRWYRMRDGKEILALFPHNDKKRWVMWTPSGYYDASPGADEIIGWHINNGKDNAADFFPISRFRATYYRPDVVAKIFITTDESEAIRFANDESGRKAQEVSLNRMLPPVVNIISPADGVAVSSTDITVRFAIRTPSGEPVTGIKVLLDGRPAETQRGVAIVPKGEDIRDIKVAVPEKDSEISIIAENKYSASEPVSIKIKWRGETKKDEFIIKPKLYVLSIGISKYEDKTLTLGLAAKDAKDFADSVVKQKNGLYRDVVVKVLTNEKATKDEILDGLDWLAKETTSKDVAMIFLAGHGVNDPTGTFYFLPANANTEKLKRTGVIFSDILTTVDSLAGKTIVFLDTCHSGNIMGTRRGAADITAIVNELASAERGAVVFASSTGRQYSQEKEEWGNGAFTKALVEGLGGKADFMGKGKVTVNMLDAYISERVKELTRGTQTPTTSKPKTIPDFPIAVTK